MRRTSIILVLCGLLATAGVTPLAAQHLEALPEDLEIALARSALPDHLRQDATVYVLRPERGFEIAVDGTNGFHALVVRNDPAFVPGDWPYETFRNDLLIPIAFDGAGAEAQMQVLFDVATARAAGRKPEEVRAEVRTKYETGQYRAPSRVGVSYMLSPVFRAYVDGDAGPEAGTFSYPHYMIYAPGVSNEQIGGATPAHPFVIEPGPHGYIVVPAGRAEAGDIQAEHAELLDRLCALRAEWCLPDRG